MSNAIKLSVLLTLIIASQVLAQEGVPRENIQVSGKLKAIRPGLLAVVTEEGEEVLVKVEARPQDVSFVASAFPNWLRPGMLVRYKANFDKSGKPTSTVRQIEVISLRADTQLGLIPDKSFGGGVAAGLFSNEEEIKKQAAPETMPFTVAGTLRGFKDGNLLVAAGRAMVRNQLDERASVSVDISDYSQAREGDSVRLNGWYYLGQKNRIFAQQVSISSSRKLGEEEPERKKADTQDAGAKKAEEGANDKSAEKALEDLFKP